MSQKIIINHLEGENGVTNKIKKAMYDAAKQFVYIGFLLWEVSQYHYYVTGGYKDVYDYAEQELGFKKTSTKNFISVARTFGNEYYGKFNEAYAQRPTMQLKPEYKDFNYSQLVEMLSMSESKRKQVKSEMTIKQIREIKKNQTTDEKKELNCAAYKQYKTHEHCYYNTHEGCPYRKDQTSDQEPEFPLEPEYETTPIEAYTESQTSDRQLEYTITLDRADWELIIEQLEDNIKYNYGDPEDQTTLQKIVDEIKGTITYTT